MTRVIPQIVNTKTALRAAVQALPDTVTVQALLGLDGASDYLVLNRRYAVYLPELLGDATTCHCELAV